MKDGQWGGYPGVPTPEPAPTVTPDPQPAFFLLTDLMDDPGLTESPRVGIRAFHEACDPHPDSSVYLIGVERADTLEKWVDWAIHLSTKPWMGRRDLARMLTYWWSNRGTKPPSRT
jgi:hypothetical protein